MYIANGNKEVLVFSCIDVDGDAITNLASATEIKFQIKESKDGSAIISKTLSDGVERNTPSTGDIQVTILPADYSGFTGYGDKYVAVQVEYSATDVRELVITERGKTIETLELKQDIIT